MTIVGGTLLSLNFSADNAHAAENANVNEQSTALVSSEKTTQTESTNELSSNKTSGNSETPETATVHQGNQNDVSASGNTEASEKVSSDQDNSAVLNNSANSSAVNDEAKSTQDSTVVPDKSTDQDSTVSSTNNVQVEKSSSSQTTQSGKVDSNTVNTNEKKSVEQSSDTEANSSQNNTGQKNTDSSKKAQSDDRSNALELIQADKAGITPEPVHQNWSASWTHSVEGQEYKYVLQIKNGKETYSGQIVTHGVGLDWEPTNDLIPKDAIFREAGSAVGKYRLYLGADFLKMLQDNNPNFSLMSDEWMSHPEPVWYGTYFTITPRPVTITVGDYQKYVGQKDPSFAANIEKAEDTSKANTGLVEGDQLNYQLVREPGETAGTYKINVVLGENPNYIVTVNAGQLTIKATQVVQESKDVTRTINYRVEGDVQAPKTVIQKVRLVREVTEDKDTHEIISAGHWYDETATSWDKVLAPKVDGYTPDISAVALQEVNEDTSDTVVLITYKKDPKNEVPNKVTKPNKPVEPNKPIKLSTPAMLVHSNKNQENSNLTQFLNSSQKTIGRESSTSNSGMTKLATEKEYPATGEKENNMTIIGLLLVSLVGLWGYFKNKLKNN
ncbi:mucin-binding protein [Enterococcus malodoratus]|uniref:mucin-binding protein n=1 Tax=Enterococcus malodoratus TaxID=71451 RepID=UPI002072CAA0|nr:MBG domain-containing protein [Enterococcus malodoratus]